MLYSSGCYGVTKKIGEMGKYQVLLDSGRTVMLAPVNIDFVCPEAPPVDDLARVKNAANTSATPPRYGRRVLCCICAAPFAMVSLCVSVYWHQSDHVLLVDCISRTMCSCTGASLTVC